MLAEETVIVALNPSKSTRRVDIPVHDVLPDRSRLEEAWTRETIVVDGGALRDFTIPPRSGRVLIASGAR